MLPNFRFLFAAIMLSVSLLVFGVGAASLFRAAHQAFAGNPSWHGAPEVLFAPKGEMPVLATMRLDPPSLDKPQTEIVLAPQTAPPPEPAPAEAEIAPAQLAALSPPDAQPAEITDGDGERGALPAAQNPPGQETPQAVADIAARSEQPNVVTSATADASPGESEVATVPPEPPSTKPDPAPANLVATLEARSPPTRIATLGDPPVEATQDNPGNEKPAKADSAKSDQNAIKKRERARRAAHRRRLAARARLAAEQLLLQQQQSDPFTQPFPPIAPIIPPPPPPIKRVPKRANHAAPVAIGGPAA